MDKPNKSWWNWWTVCLLNKRNTFGFGLFFLAGKNKKGWSFFFILHITMSFDFYFVVTLIIDLKGKYKKWWSPFFSSFISQWVLIFSLLWHNDYLFKDFGSYALKWWRNIWNGYFKQCHLNVIWTLSEKVWIFIWNRCQNRHVTNTYLEINYLYWYHF